MAVILENIRDSALKKDYKDRTIEDWIVILYYIYQNHNRASSAYNLWLQVVNDASQLGETVRREIIRTAFSSELNVYTQIARLFSRISAFIGKYIYDSESVDPTDPIGMLMRQKPTEDYIGGEERYEKWILMKYPHACPTCGSCPCICASHRDIMEKRHDNQKYDEFWTIHRGEFKKNIQKYRSVDKGKIRGATIVKYNSSLEDWVTMFREIYSSGHIEVSLESIGFHFLEEVGEVSDGILCLDELYQFKQKIGVYKDGKVDICKKIEQKCAKDPKYRKFWHEFKNRCSDRQQRIIPQKALPYLRQIHVVSIKEELADVFSWMCAIVNKIEILTRNWSPEFRPRSISDALHERYRTSDESVGCRYCSETICADDCILGSTVRKGRNTRLSRIEHKLFPKIIM